MKESALPGMSQSWYSKKEMALCKCIHKEDRNIFPSNISVEILLRVRGHVVFCRCVLYLPMMYVYQQCPY